MSCPLATPIPWVSLKCMPPLLHVVVWAPTYSTFAPILPRLSPSWTSTKISLPYGGFTPATARLALVDGQPPSDFARPGLSWIQTVPLHTPALGYGSFPSTFPAPSTSSSLSTSTATASVSAASTVVVSTPPVSQLVTSTPLRRYSSASC